MFNKKLAIILFAGLISLLSGCSGGGGDSTSSAAPAAVPVIQIPLAGAISSFMQTSHNYNLSSVIGADNYTAQISFTPGTGCTFAGHPASSMIMSGIMRKNGVTITTDTNTLCFDASPFKELGSVDGSGNYTIASNQQLLPSSATVGQSGAFASFTTYYGSSSILTKSSTVETWSVEPDTATTAWACFISTETPMFGDKTTDTECYKVDQTGNVSAMKLSFIVDGQPVTFK